MWSVFFQKTHIENVHKSYGRGKKRTMSIKRRKEGRNKGSFSTLSEPCGGSFPFSVHNSVRLATKRSRQECARCVLFIGIFTTSQAMRSLNRCMLLGAAWLQPKALSLTLVLQLTSWCHTMELLSWFRLVTFFFFFLNKTSRMERTPPTYNIWLSEKKPGMMKQSAWTHHKTQFSQTDSWNVQNNKSITDHQCWEFYIKTCIMLFHTQ